MIPPSPLPNEDNTGVPILRTWPRVYAFVLAFLGLWIGFLIWLTQRFA